MRNVKWPVWVGGAVLALGLIVLPVYAHCGKCADSAKEMISAMEGGKITLARAVENCEKECKGKAVTANCSLNAGKLSIEVVCLVGDKLTSCTVNDTGKVTNMKETESIYGAHEGHEKETPKRGG